MLESTYYYAEFFGKGTIVKAYGNMTHKDLLRAINSYNEYAKSYKDVHTVIFGQMIQLRNLGELGVRIRNNMTPYRKDMTEYVMNAINYYIEHPDEE